MLNLSTTKSEPTQPDTGWVDSDFVVLKFSIAYSSFNLDESRLFVLGWAESDFVVLKSGMAHSSSCLDESGLLMSGWVDSDFVVLNLGIAYSSSLSLNIKRKHVGIPPCPLGLFGC